MATKPNIDIVLERLGQNTKLTKEVKHEVEEGFRTLSGRVAKNTQDIFELQLQRRNDKENLQSARDEAKKIISEAAAEARALIFIDKKSAEKESSDDESSPKVGTNKWLLVTLVTIILALITALGAR